MTGLAVITLAVIVILLIGHIVATIRKKAAGKQVASLKRAGSFFAGVMVLNVCLVVFSQLTTSTPGIRDESGIMPENSIAELVQLELNGRNQWINIRGWDKSKPVLLFLAGGPGGSQLAAVRHELAELEKHFVVVGWDQPGSAKSYYAEKIENITVETYIQDGCALTDYLKERFAQEKIYLIGESWGSALGIFMIDRAPGSYHAMIGTGQMVDFVKTEQIDYATAMEIAVDRKDTKLIRKLEANGVPPYYGKDVAWKSAAYLNYLSAIMANNIDIHNSGYDTIRDIASPEYGLVDKINFVRGVLNTYSYVYPQLYGLDLRKDHRDLDVPVSFFLGRHDINAPTSLVEEYVEGLAAPQKEIVWFEHSGHSPWINEGPRFTSEALAFFLNEPLKEAACNMDFLAWDAKEIWEYPLDKGDSLRVELSRESGAIGLRVYGKNGSEVYVGNELDSCRFTVTVPETDDYVIELRGSDATGSLLICEIEKEGSF